VFFLIPFALVRVYQDSGLAAGLRLSILPVAPGLLAPVGGALYDRFAPSADLLWHADLLGGPRRALRLPRWHARVMLALAIVGGGQGLFISPNSSAMPSYVSNPRFLKLAWPLRPITR
jgi:hypothetical protein